MSESNESINPDNVNPHFARPEEFGMKSQADRDVPKKAMEAKTPDTSGFLSTGYPQPCPSCGHCPTCGRGPWPMYTGPFWQYIPNTTTCGTVTLGTIS